MSYDMKCQTRLINNLMDEREILLMYFLVGLNFHKLKCNKLVLCKFTINPTLF